MTFYPDMPDPHKDQPIYTMGEALDEAQAAMVMIHGRGASAQDILTLASELAVPSFCYLAPQAAGHVWYPNRFVEPVVTNEPWLSSALDLIDKLFERLQEQGMPTERTILLGFSQGACLALEYAARNPRRYGGLVGLSGGLIGADSELRDYEGDLAGTPVFLGCSDIDPHIPEKRVRHTADIMTRSGGKVTTRIYPGMGHTVNQDELDFVRSMMERILEVEKGNAD
jgi:phospholipase/carboxylesterase